MRRPGIRHVAVLALLAAAGSSAAASCEALYPAARVTAKLAEPRYQHCRHVAQDYAAQLTEQATQLEKLRSAYRRKLDAAAGADADEQARAQLRLAKYDSDRSRLMSAAAALRQYPDAPAATAASAAASAALGDRALARQWLKDGHMASQSLHASIAGAAGAFTANETQAYCQQDYSFRVGAGLHALLASCLKDE